MVTENRERRRLQTIRGKIARFKTNDNRVHIIASKKGWAIKREGTQKASFIVDSKSAAVTRAKKLSGVKNLIVHGKDGTVERWKSVGDRRVSA